MTAEQAIRVYDAIHGAAHATHGQDGSRRMGQRLHARILPMTSDLVRVECQCGSVLEMTGLQVEENKSAAEIH